MGWGYEHGLLTWIARGLLAPFLCDREDRAFVTGLWLLAIAFGVGAVFALRFDWLGTGIVLGIVAALGLTLAGYWGE